VTPDAQADATLALELHGTLLSELGARAIYGDLARRCGDAELARLLELLREEQDQQVRELREVMRSLGLRAPESSARRRVLAWLLAAARPIVGQRLVLRLCAQAADRAARAHATFQLCLRELGHEAAAALCGRMSERRRRHAFSLEAWVQNA
jgi:rubrerythrin